MLEKFSKLQLYHEKHDCLSTRNTVNPLHVELGFLLSHKEKTTVFLIAFLRYIHVCVMTLTGTFHPQ